MYCENDFFNFGLIRVAGLVIRLNMMARFVYIYNSFSVYSIEEFRFDLSCFFFMDVGV